MESRDTSPPKSPPVTSTPAPMWARAAVGALLSLIPSTFIAVLIVAVALVMPLLFPASTNWHRTARTAAFLIACTYGLGMMYCGWLRARRRG